MKGYLLPILLVCSTFCLTSEAQTTSEFNSTPTTPLSVVKATLQNHCWYFPGFDVNNNGWTPAIEGDGAMVSAASCSASQGSGIYTPLMDVAGNLAVTFRYKINSTLSAGERRWIKIYLVDYNNIVQIKLDSVEINGANTGICDYSGHFIAGSGCYKVFINYQGTGGAACIAIDQLSLSAPMLFGSGCPQAASAVNDRVDGAPNRHASGNVMLNDAYPATASLYLVTNSPHGNVTLNSDGTFSFEPHSGFTGLATSFTYKICDNSICSPICSDDATVTINFPSGSFLPASLVDFKGLYKDNGKVEIGWTTNFEQRTDRFIIERSFDGLHWADAGEVKGQGISTVKHAYTFIDNVGRNTANKKDLYYRLKQVDLDAGLAISRILVVRVYNTHSLKMISVTPNPVRKDIAANIQLNERSVVVLKILTASGSEVMRKTLQLNEGAASIVMDGSSNLTPGMYFLEMVVNSKERMMVKLIKE